MKIKPYTANHNFGLVVLTNSVYCENVVAHSGNTRQSTFHSIERENPALTKYHARKTLLQVYK